MVLPGLQRHRELNGGAPPGWQAMQPKGLPVPKEEGADPPRLMAIVSTWYDSDVIGATVRNCFAQGCERVYLLDNDSPDDTVKVAEAAGATVAQVYKTQFYDDDLRIRHQNELIRRVVEQEKAADLWWLALDGDEFPTGIKGEPLVDSLTGLSKKVRLVGSNFIDLYPIAGHHYEVGKHPAACMTMGSWRRGGINRYCQCGHWKHAAVRYFEGRYHLAHNRGNHAVTTSGTAAGGGLVDSPRIMGLYEADFDCTMFHAPIRGEEHSRARLKALCTTGRNTWDDHVTAGHGAVKRWQSLDDVYAERWDKINIPHTQMFGRSVRGIALYPWRVLLKEFDETLIHDNMGVK